MRRWLLCLLLAVTAAPAPAGYPVIDVPDLVMDTVSVLTDIEQTLTEIEKMVKLYEQYAHWKEQARKFTGRGFFDLRALVLLAQAELAPLFIDGDEDLDTLLTCMDGVWDLRLEFSRLQAAVEALYPPVVTGQATGPFRLGGQAADTLEQATAALSLQRAAAAHALAWVGESKFNTKADRDRVQIPQTVFTGAEPADDTRGRQLAYGLINAGLLQARGLMDKRQALIRALSQVRALRQAVALDGTRRGQEHVAEMLRRIGLDAAQFNNASGAELILP